MSVVFVVAPVIVGGGWPLLLVAASAAAAQMGLKALKSGPPPKVAERVEIEVENVHSITEGVRPDETAKFSDGRVEVTLHKDPRGKVTVHVEGGGKSKAELHALGTELMQRMIQQYAYRKVTAALTQKGFQIVEEEADATRAVRVRFRKIE